MGLTSLFKRKDESSGAAVPAPQAVLQARTRARRRLIGATVLLGIGVIGFPLLFETQPRPIALDIPIEIPRKDTAPPLVLPAARGASAATVADGQAQAVPAAASSSSVPAGVNEPAEAQGQETKPAAASRPVPEAAVPAVGTAAAPRHDAAASASLSAGKAPARPVTTDDGTRARALLDGKPGAAPKASEPGVSRVVVQVGAYTDADRLREARQKVEKLGMKSYTQVVDADGGRRTRVRVGPFASRAEAEQAAARIKAAGLPVAILTL